MQIHKTNFSRISKKRGSGKTHKEHTLASLVAASSRQTSLRLAQNLVK